MKKEYSHFEVEKEEEIGIAYIASVIGFIVVLLLLVIALG